MKYIKVFIKYRGLIAELVSRDVKIRYRRSILGLLWALLNPLLTMIILNVVFSTLFKNSIENFAVYLLCGLIIFNFFSEATNNAMTSILTSASLIKKVYIPKYLLPLSKVLSTVVNLLASFLALIIVMIVTGSRPTPMVLLSIIPLVMVIVFSIGIGFLLSSVAVFFRDTIHLYGVFLTAWLYLTPILYPTDILPEGVKQIVMMNPLTNYILYLRTVTIYAALPSFEMNCICLINSLIALGVGLFIFYKTQDKFILNL